MKRIFWILLICGSVASAYTKNFGHGSVDFAGEDNPTSKWNEKPDFARLEKTNRLTPFQRNALYPEDIAKLSQDEIDQVYARSTSGPIPVGAFHGLVVMKADGIERLKKMFYQEHQKMTAISQKICSLFNKSDDPIECLAEILWKGKVFYRPNDLGVVELRNAISLIWGTKLAELIKGPGFVLEAKKDLFFGTPKYMLFPAKVYCGQSLLDSRKESIIIDYSHGDDFSPFIQGFDNLAGRSGFDVRDEIRMVRPGFYLGRAYLGKFFVLNFTLYNPDLAKTPASDKSQDSCFTGKTTRQ